ncbi:hypothetical protein FRB99_001731 [Tulasnella sp. 403]|nr:hypothetical protein FRB99_001731 [Tulasnella sp. 403]
MRSLQLKKSSELDSSQSKINWDDLDAFVNSPIPGSDGPPASPPTAWLEDTVMPIYGASPMEPVAAIIRCKDCDKPVLSSALSSHRDNCEKIRKLLAKNKKDTGSKRKAEDDGSTDAPAKKKTKKELAKATSGTKRVKGPAKLDEHCCVINEKGQPCSRSITCKVHSMVAKRAVQGRSKPYDELLLDWKRANIPGFVEPVKRETKAERKAKKEAEKEAKRLEMLAAGIVPGAKKAKAAKGEGKKNKKTDKNAPGEKGGKKGAKAGQPGPEEEEEEDIDSDLEFEFLVHAVRSARPYTAVPLAQPTDVSNFFVARNEILRNCHDTMGFALSGNNIRGHAMSIVAS